MARTQRSAKLEDRTNRAKLKAGARQWVPAGEGLALGYRKTEKGFGMWQGRLWRANGYTFETLGEADDLREADGTDVLTYYQANDKVRAWQVEAASSEGRSPRSAITVELAIRTYADSRESQKYADNDRERILARLTDGMKATAVAKLGKADVETWRNGLVEQGSAEVQRKSKDTANRLLNILKAALNHAFEDDKNRIPSDNAWRKVKAFKKVGASRQDHFTATQALALIDAARKFDPPFADLLEGAFHSGARPPGELAALNVHHFHPEMAQLAITDSKTGPRDTTLAPEGVAFFRRMAQGKQPRDVLLPRADGTRWGKNHQQKPMRKALEVAGLPSSATIYTMRHTYISLAGIRGMPIHAVAKNVGTSVKMIERHYGKFFSDDFRRIVEKYAPALRVVETLKLAA